MSTLLVATIRVCQFVTGLTNLLCVVSRFIEVRLQPAGGFVEDGGSAVRNAAKTTTING